MYIGQSINMLRRRNAHFHALHHGKHSNKHLQAVFSKYGENSFTFTGLEDCAVALLTSREQAWVDQMRCLSVPLCNFGEQVSHPTRGYKHTAQARAKISAAGLRRPRSAQVREKIAAALRGRTRPPEIGAAVRRALTGIKRSEDFRNKISASITPERRALLSLAAKAANIGAKRTSETRARLAEAATKQHQKTRLDPQLWEAVKAEALVRYGKWAGNAIAWAGKAYRRRGGRRAHDV